MVTICTITLVASVLAAFIVWLIPWPRGKTEYEICEYVEPFSASNYFDRIGKEPLKIMEEYKPVDQTIILWWGFDGLRLNEDGSLEWISRKPVNQNVFYQPAQSIAQVSQPIDYSMCQSTRAQIDELMSRTVALQIQAAQSAQNMAMFSALYPSYSAFQHGLMMGAPPLSGCCCNQTILR